MLNETDSMPSARISMLCEVASVTRVDAGDVGERWKCENVVEEAPLSVRTCVGSEGRMRPEKRCVGVEDGT